MAESRSRVSPQQYPRLRIRVSHWLSWVTVTAVLLALHRSNMVEEEWAVPRDPAMAARSRWIWSVNRVANLSITPIHALAICGLGLAAWQRVRSSKSFPRQPGHWLLVNLGAFVLSREVSRIILQQLIFPRYDDRSLPQAAFETLFSIWMPIMQSMPLLCGIAAAIVAACQMSGQLLWRTVFLLAATSATCFVAVELLEGRGFMFFAITWWTGCFARALAAAATIAVLIAVARELWQRIPRDLMHFVGVIVAVLAMIHGIVWDFTLWLAFSVVLP